MSDLTQSQTVIEIDVRDAEGRVLQRYQLADDGDYIIGRDREIAHILIDDKSVSRRHAVLRRKGDRLALADVGSLNGTLIAPTSERAGARETTDGWQDWPRDAYATIGLFSLYWRADAMIAEAGDGDDQASPVITTLGADRGVEATSDEQGAEADASGAATDLTQLFATTELVPFSQLLATAEKLDIPVETKDYLCIGGGMGSFMFVDHLRIVGVSAQAIRVIGVDPDPVRKWADYCQNSQIPAHERIRSHSASTPDNIWGFPGYALRETWQRVRAGRRDALEPVLRVFGEPLFAETYTPRLGDVLASVSREAQRIGWQGMVRCGRAIALRKLDDGRYALHFRTPLQPGQGEETTRDWICIARHVHIATGYPAIRVLTVLQDYRRRHSDDPSVVNAYEPHDELYRMLEKRGGTVLVEGRGIVASRILQRLGELHQRNPTIRIVHLMRYPVTSGHRSDLARRPVRHHVEVQPFNWPKACWGGALQQRLERADSAKRSEWMDVWGGTTTADRKNWRVMLAEGTRQGWYQPVFGDLIKVRRRDGQLALTIQPPKHASRQTISADALIDCTGLVADVTTSAFLRDLIDTHALPRNRAAGTGPERGMSGLRVTNAFEVKALRTGSGRVYAAGIITANGPYAAVDSFLGLSFAALRAIDDLVHSRTAGLRRFGPLASVRQWIKWCRGVSP